MAYIKGKQKLYSTNRDDFKAFQNIESYEIFERYKEFTHIVNTRINDEYRHFLSQPVKDGGTIEWHSKSWKEEPRKLTELEGDARNVYEKILTDTLSHYHTTINSLQNGNDENKKEAEYLEKAVKFVDNNFVFCYDGLTVLGVWGMKIRDGKRDDTGLYSADVVRDDEIIVIDDVVELPEENDISEEPTDFQPNIVIENLNIYIENKNEPVVPVSVAPPQQLPWWKRWYSGGVGGVVGVGGTSCIGGGCLPRLIRWLAFILLLLLVICFVRKCSECLTCYRCQQVVDQTGYLPENEDWDNIPEDYDPPFDDEDLDNLGETVCLEHLFPPVGNQGQYGTCVVWAVGYNLKTAMNAIDNSWSPDQLAIAINQTSPKDLWMLIPESNKGERCRGTTFEPAFRALVLAGAASMEQVPYENLGDCAEIETGDVNNRFESFSRVPIPNEINLKGYLDAGVPLAFGARLGDRFMGWNSDAVISADTYNNRGMLHAYHAMVLTGYDDNRNAFRVRNSWGPGWGDQGSIWVDYDFFVKSFCIAAFVARNAQDEQSYHY